jgi:hypothetical protein
MATTTNYSWTTPDDTDLVKDGAAAIRTLGSSIDTTTKALNPSTTLGDIEYRSSTANTNTRLGIGSTGNVLTVTGGVPTWAAPAAGGMTSIATGTLSSTETSITSIPSGYIDLVLLINNPFVNIASAFGFRLNSTSTASHQVAMLKSSSNGVGNDPSATYLDANGNNVALPTSTSTNSAFLYIRNYTSTLYKNIELGYSNSSDNWSGVGFVPGLTAAVTSIQVRTRNGTSTFSGGTYTLYGVK